MLPSTVTHKRPGEDAILPCWKARDCAVNIIEWSREDIATGDYVFFYRNDRAYKKYQLDAYKSRVDLKDPSMDHGDYSIIVKNLTENDTALYCCKVFYDCKKTERTYTALNVWHSASPEMQYNSGDGREIALTTLSVVSCIITVVFVL